MARYTHQSLDLYQQSPSTLDSKPVFSEEDEMSVLDDKILDSTSPALSSLPDHRKTSYDQSADVFASHRDPLWSDYAHPFAASHSRQSSQVMFSNPFPYAQHNNPWALPRADSGSCTPTAVYDHLPSDFDHASAASFSGGAVGSMNTMHMPAMSYRQGLAYAAPAAVAMSPQSSQGWVPAPTELPDSSSRPTKSPTYRNDSPMNARRDALREGLRDGIRKKNARFDIPAERTLSNIDQLISQSTNEEEIKELKQQKRLLRNRQAALDSRQRKKLHTEKLEEEKKQLTQYIGQLEEALQSMKIREAEMLREKNEWLNAQQQINQYIDNVHMEKDELIRVHTLETAELRKKNNILKETVEKLERQVRVPNAPALSNDFHDLENLAMDGSSWDDFGMVNNLSLDAEPASGSTVTTANTMATSTNDSKTTEKNADYPFSWNAFYMCLLFGAFIASNSSSLTARSLPTLSEEYRTESANVLKAVLASTPPELVPSSDQAPVAPSAPPGPLPTTISGAEMARMTSGAGATSTLDELHNNLALPTKEQEQEQVFSLTPDQYNSLTTYDEHANFKQPQQSSNLQQALAAMRNGAAQNSMHMKSTSDVYSRSLMWDRVPEKVIHDFRRMVQEYGAGSVKRED